MRVRVGVRVGDEGSLIFFFGLCCFLVGGVHMTCALNRTGISCPLLVSKGVLSAALTHPFDTIKSCMQVSLRRGGKGRGLLTSYVLKHGNPLSGSGFHFIHAFLSFSSCLRLFFSHITHTNNRPGMDDPGRATSSNRNSQRCAKRQPPFTKKRAVSKCFSEVGAFHFLSLLFAPPSSNCYCSNSIPHSPMLVYFFFVLGPSLLHERVSCPPPHHRMHEAGRTKY